MTLNYKIVDGLIPTEKVIQIEGADGRIEEIAVPSQSIQNNKFTLSEVGDVGTKF